MARSSRFSAVFFPGEPEPIDENLQPGQAKAINAQAKKLRKTIFIGANQTPVLSPGVSSPRTDAKEASLTEAEETKDSKEVPEPEEPKDSAKESPQLPEGMGSRF